ncbi:Uncharacterized protein DBV15_02600 [Temnothorax longispinosus]|uniref:Uncharacterized protein n=1 Tax=Temnothorax longispinosus TaxID=300112 RepID=A0A4S2KC10_9HYME|nr:Uncharacterized protein DBV15_02600 [Temnothorax longispinosus]
MCHRPARRGAVHGDDPVCRHSRASPDAESTCINATATGGRLLRAYPNVSRAALHLHSAWPGRPARNCEMSRLRRRRVRFFERPSRASVKSRNERGPAFDREIDSIYWRHLVPCFVQSFSNVIPEAFAVSLGRKPMTLPKVDVSAAEAQAPSLVNNKSVALPTRSPRARGVSCRARAHTRNRVHVYAPHTREVYGAGLCKLGHTMTFTDISLNPTMSRVSLGSSALNLRRESVKWQDAARRRTTKALPARFYGTATP